MAIAEDGVLRFQPFLQMLNLLGEEFAFRVLDQLGAPEPGELEGGGWVDPDMHVPETEKGCPRQVDIPFSINLPLREEILLDQWLWPAWVPSPPK